MSVATTLAYYWRRVEKIFGNDATFLFGHFYKMTSSTADETEVRIRNGKRESESGSDRGCGCGILSRGKTSFASTAIFKGHTFGWVTCQPRTNSAYANRRL